MKRVSSSGPTGFLSDLIKCLGWICLAVEQLQCCYICLSVFGWYISALKWKEFMSCVCSREPSQMRINLETPPGLCPICAWSPESPTAWQCSMSGLSAFLFHPGNSSVFLQYFGILKACKGRVWVLCPIQRSSAGRCWWVSPCADCPAAGDEVTVSSVEAGSTYSTLWCVTSFFQQCFSEDSMDWVWWGRAGLQSGNFGFEIGCFGEVRSLEVQKKQFVVKRKKKRC